jgi:hemoglobin/transferrin/lactoferrin receptor protein
MSKRIFISFIILAFVLNSQAQEDSLMGKSMEEVVISANKFAEKKKNVAQKIDLISSRQIAAYNSQNTGDLLINTGNVFVQKSQQGGSSPVIRGFEASRVLLVIDGIRMNNAVYRAGHLQNVITVDQNMLERVEVLYGPASTLYGSDALGGILHLRTKMPRLTTTGQTFYAGTGFARYSTANNEKTIHADLNIGGKKFAWLQAYTFSDFADMKMGSSYPDKYPSFGKRPQYIDRINGVDSVVNNPDPEVQKFSGYKQWDITEKFLFKQNDKISHLLNLQMSNSTDVPRYDRLQDIRNFGGSIGTTLRYAEWYYGPQERELAAYELNIARPGFADAFRANIHYQHIEESRQTREYRRYDQFDSRREKLNIVGFFIDGRKNWKQNELTVGIDGQLNDLKSVADRTNIITGEKTSLDTRYPDEKNKMNYFGLYAQHTYKIRPNRLILNDGIRLQIVSLNSTIINNSFFNFPYTGIEQNNFAVTGNLGLVFLPSENLRLAGNFSTGFRAPNVDDIAKIFESITAAQQLVVPNPDIKPEYTFNIDLGINATIAEKIKFEVTGFYTWFKNAIVKAPFKLNGQDSVMYNGIMSQVLANQNKNEAFVCGFNSNITVNFTTAFSWFSAVTYTYGRYDKFTGQQVPLDHIPPVFGKTSFSYRKNKISTEAYALYNGWKKIKDYNPDGEDNQQYATADGMPSWATLNWKGNYQFTRNFQLQLGVENILDRNYRHFASGFSAAGRNFIVALRAGF